MIYSINNGVGTMTKKDKIQLSIIWGLAIVCWFAAFVAYEVYTSTPASAASMSEVSDKYDGDCDPHATVGRCADKCPAPTAEGAYNQLGTDPTTGAAICHFVYSNACPYTEAVSADDPMCYKNQPSQAPVTQSTAPSASTSTSTPQSTSATPKPTNTEQFDGAGASGTFETTPEPTKTDNSTPRINNEQSKPTANTNENEKSNTAQIVGGSSIILTVIGVIGAVIKRKFF